MKQLIPPLLVMTIFLSVSLADYSDGWITAGEYEGFVTWTSEVTPLIVEGGGAIAIEMRNFSRLEVRSTSSPLGLGVGGISYIDLLGPVHLDFLSGLTREITTASIATADLRGGSINYISSEQYTVSTGAGPYIDIYAQPGWSWMSDDPLVGIEGLWQNGSPFAIEFINEENYDPVWTNINVVEVPEPATLSLLSLGGLLLRRKK